MWFWSFDICKLVHSILQGTKLISLDHKKMEFMEIELNGDWDGSRCDGSQEGIDTSVRFKIVGFFFQINLTWFCSFFVSPFWKTRKQHKLSFFDCLLIIFSSSTVYCICCWIFANTVRISDSSHSVTGRQVQVSSIGISLPVEHYEFQF